MSRRPLRPLLVLCCLLLATGAWVLRPEPPREGPGTAEPPSDSAIEDDPVAPATAAGGPAARRPADPSPPLPPLPAPGLPLAEQLDALVARADAGDGHAACRLAMRLQRCGHASRVVERLHAHMAGFDAVVARETPERAARLDDMLDAHQSALRDCAGLSPALQSRAGEYLRQAALAGVPDAMISYAAGHHLDFGGGVAYVGAGGGFGGDYAWLRDPAFETWRREAPRMMDAALADGRLDAVHLLHIAYFPERGPLLPLRLILPADPVRAAALERLQQLLFNSRGLTRVDVTPAQAHDAAELAGRWHREYFGERVGDPLPYGGMPPFAIVPADTGEAVDARARFDCDLDGHPLSAR